MFRLLDLCCGAGGAAEGYRRAGFEVVGVDIRPQPNYPFEFHQADALEFPLDGFDAVHASPPCQAYSRMTAKWGAREDHPKLIASFRQRFLEAGLPYVIENVELARPDMQDPLMLCGSTFGLDVQRHRLFESNVSLAGASCNHGWQLPRFRRPDKRRKALSPVVPVYGRRNYAGDLELRRQAMDIDWMENAEIIESIPPAYTEFLGRQLYATLRARAEASSVGVGLLVVGGLEHEEGAAQGVAQLDQRPG